MYHVSSAIITSYMYVYIRRNFRETRLCNYLVSIALNGNYVKIYVCIHNSVTEAWGAARGGGAGAGGAMTRRPPR